jgi:hypothetical protein
LLSTFYRTGAAYLLAWIHLNPNTHAGYRAAYGGARPGLAATCGDTTSERVRVTTEGSGLL